MLLDGFKGKKEASLDRRTSLAGIPVFNEGASLTEDKEGRVVIHIRMPERKGLMGRLLPYVNEKRIRLDEVGSFVAGMVNGKRRVSEIVDRFVDRYRVNRREAELSMAQFFKSLARRRVISIVIK